MSIIERFNITIRKKIMDYMKAYNTHNFIDVLNKIVNNYNETIHSTTNMKPNNIDIKKKKN